MHPFDESFSEILVSTVGDDCVRDQDDRRRPRMNVVPCIGNGEGFVDIGGERIFGKLVAYQGFRRKKGSQLSRERDG